MLAKRKRAAHRHSVATPIPVLSRFWREDGVWNATAQHLPVAAFGDTFEQSYNNLVNALISHFQSLDDAGKLDEAVTMLERKAQARFRVNEFSADTPFVKMLVPREQEEAFDCV